MTIQELWRQIEWTKLAERSFIERGVLAQLNKPHWDPQSSVLGNLGNNLQEIRQRSQGMIADQRQAMELQSSLQPGFALRRWRDYLQQGDSVVTNPWDKLLLDSPEVL